MSVWTHAQLAILRRLREGFLQGTAGDADYWRSQEELQLYDQTFAKRIGWKWDAVLGELQLRGWRPHGTRLVDLGCGTGMASRRVLEHWKDFFWRDRFDGSFWAGQEFCGGGDPATGAPLFSSDGESFGDQLRGCSRAAQSRNYGARFEGAIVVVGNVEWSGGLFVGGVGHAWSESKTDWRGA